MIDKPVSVLDYSVFDLFSRGTRDAIRQAEIS